MYGDEPQWVMAEKERKRWLFKKRQKRHGLAWSVMAGSGNRVFSYAI